MRVSFPSLFVPFGEGFGSAGEGQPWEEGIESSAIYKTGVVDGLENLPGGGREGMLGPHECKPLSQYTQIYRHMHTRHTYVHICT